MAHTSREELLKKLEHAKSMVEIGAEYQHVKSGGRYVVTDIVIREDNEEIRVIYQELEHTPTISWDRSFDGTDGWIVPTEVDGKESPRFVRCA
ncbi:DUF1653 domain-containing protein [candidate division WWE3 bacterium]|nr:DUF1653 domain-containing protein [candidate division WWE3 bacterium]